MGATCAAAQTHMHSESQRIPSQEYDQNGANSLPSEWRPCASKRPIAAIQVAGRGGGSESAGSRLLTCGQGSQHAKSAKQARFSGHMSGKRRFIRPVTEGHGATVTVHGDIVTTRRIVSPLSGVTT